ncbi:MAG: alpha/beta hydrolase, partial [Sneathiellales bacterium]|nr:alpha/beta hydrolase [Sneathiellales bacterium]
FYKIQGNGPRIILISGTNSDTRHKPGVYDIPGIEKYQLVNFDNRGMGQSSTPANEPPSMQAYAHDVEQLMEKIGWEKAHIIGISFGGMIAQHFALNYPEKVYRLVLCCTSSGGIGGASYPLQNLQDLDAENYARTFMKLMNLRHTEAWQKENPRQAEQIFALHWQSADATFNNPVKHAAMKEQLKARADHDTYDRLEEIKMPVLVACGTYDGLAPPENSRNMVNRIPNAEFMEFKGGHMFMKEDPSAWPSMLGFLTDRPGEAK